MDVIDTEGEVLIIAALPGVEEAAVRLVIDGAHLLIAGERSLPAELGHAVIHRLELPQGRFERRVPLPAGRYDHIHRQTMNGCLVVSLRKSAPASMNDAPAKPRNPAPGGEARPGRNELPPPADAFIVVPSRRVTMFPEIVLPFPLESPQAIAASQQAVRQQRQVVVLLQRDPETAEPTGPDMHRVGVVANILRYVTTPTGEHHIICQGPSDSGSAISSPAGRSWSRAAWRWPSRRRPARRSRRASSTCAPRPWRSSISSAKRIGRAARDHRPDHPGRGPGRHRRRLHRDIPPPKKQEVLETLDLKARLDKVSAILAERLNVLRLSAEVGARTNAALSDRQRQAILRERMAAIQEGARRARSNGEREMADLQAAIDKAGMPEEAKAPEAEKELSRLKRMPDAARRIRHDPHLARLDGRAAVGLAGPAADRHR